MIGTSPVGFLNLPQPSWSQVTCDSEIAEVLESGRAIGHFIWKQTLCHSHSCHDFFCSVRPSSLWLQIIDPFLMVKCPLHLNFVGPSLGTLKFLGSAGSAVVERTLTDQSLCGAGPVR